VIDIESLSRDEKLELIERLWNSLTSNEEDIPIPEWHRDLLDQRLDDLEREGPVGISVDELVGRLRGRDE
jgi:putative addiction module component (TIGR02574 family)